jgi:hypothetical protein
MPRFLTKMWTVTLGGVTWRWLFGEICEEALFKAAAVYNAFRWLERPDYGKTHRGFSMFTSPIGTNQFTLDADKDVKTKAYARFRKLLRNVAVDNRFRKTPKGHSTHPRSPNRTRRH